MELLLRCMSRLLILNCVFGCSNPPHLVSVCHTDRNQRPTCNIEEGSCRFGVLTVRDGLEVCREEDVPTPAERCRSPYCTDCRPETIGRSLDGGTSELRCYACEIALSNPYEGAPSTSGAPLSLTCSNMPAGHRVQSSFNGSMTVASWYDRYNGPNSLDFGDFSIQYLLSLTGVPDNVQGRHRAPGRGPDVLDATASSIAIVPNNGIVVSSLGIVQCVDGFLPVPDPSHPQNANCRIAQSALLSIRAQ